MKKSFLLLLLLIIVNIGVFAANDKPNVVLVFIDDMGWADFSCFGNTQASTPNIDSMAAEGISFHQFYVNSPVCSPSRVAISTGQYPQRHKITGFLSNSQHNHDRGMVNFLSIEAPMLARYLNENGYATGHFGKWHMGGQRDVTGAPYITEYGFDESLTNFEGMGAKFLPETKEPVDGEIVTGRIWEDATDLGGPVEWRLRSTITGGFASRAIDFIDDAQENDKPFYINVWPDDVHTPWFPSIENWADTDNGLFLSVLEEMDTQFKSLFDRIKEDEKLKDNTLILICSDNGPDPKRQLIGDLKGTKGTLYEGGIRSPLIVWGNGLLNQQAMGTVNDTSVFSAIDLVPSIMTMVGIPIPSNAKFDGEDVSETIMGNAKDSRSKPIFWRRPPGWKSVFGQTGLPDLAVRSGSYKLLCDHGGEKPLLYNIYSDPGETNNLAEEEPEIVDSLKKLVLEWNESVPPDGDTPRPIDTTNNLTGKTVFYLPFENNIDDSSENNIEFQQAQGETLAYDDGPFGKSLVLDNTMLLSEDNVFNIYASHTFSAWVKIDQKTTNNQVFVHQKDDPELNPGRVHLEALNSNNFSCFTGGVGDERTTNTDSITEGVWYHVASVFDRDLGQKMLYVNGVLKDTKTLASSEQCKAEYVIGGFKDESRFYVNGGIDELVLFREALTESEINTIMNDGVRKVDTSVSEAGRQSSEQTIKIVDGGALNELIFEYNSGADSDYEIYDMSGRIRHKGKSLSGQSVFLSMLPHGNYLVKVEVNNLTKVRKYFVESQFRPDCYEK